MSNEERMRRVRGRLTDAMRAAIEERIAQGKVSAAMRSALDRAPSGVALESAVPLAALEAIVQLTGRPPLMVRGGKVELEPLPDFAPDTKDKIVDAQKWAPSVGRIEFLNASMLWGGTGWVVDKRANGHILITNRHVAKVVARRVADGSGAFMRNGYGILQKARIDFLEEEGSVADDESRTAGIEAIDYLADDLEADVAILRVTTAGFDLPTPMTLSDREAEVKERVAIIGYPAYDPRNDHDAQAQYFKDVYEVKRFAPGYVIQALSGDSTLSHDCTSLGGNSGSPVLSLETGHVVGLHFAGLYGRYNSAVGAATLKKLLAGTTTSVAVPAAGGGGAEGRNDSHHGAEHFQGRQGFSTQFLGGGTVATPWPGLPAKLAGGLAQPSDNPPEPNELRYTHFGVKYSGTLRMPLITAVNIDGNRAVRIKRSQDQWFSDGRIDKAIQLNSRNFADARIDRGHMVRREDPNWGSEVEAEQANFDTFHYVNAIAQHSLLNQGKALWQGLENYILDSARTEGFQVCVFTGPVLSDDDEEIDGAPVPMEFWKLVAMLDSGGKRLHATAYLLSQGKLIRDLMEKRSRSEAYEGVVLGAYRTFQIAVADLAAATGYDLAAYERADPLAPSEEGFAQPETREPRFIPIEDYGMIRL
ncbi:MAG TPA: DNA/RNA non-specific endonuclease [Allosphingosinicella sp.]|jgi:endonuclease G